MLDEKFLLLEERVSSLLDEVKRLRKENASLVQETESLRREADKALEANQELESQLAEGSTKEHEVRERLRLIIEKIDAMEQMADAE
jgi:regulator of replication initiation timing